MPYTSILVNLRLGEKNARILGIVADLAGRYGAHVLGVAVCQPVHISYSDAYLVSDLAVQDREVRMKEMAEAEAEFRDTMTGRAASLQWHARMAAVPLAREVADQARGADLVVTAAERNRGYFETSNPLRIGDLVMQAGRPVLVVPDSAEQLSLDHILVGWKDGCEARRAVFDALPLLGKARRVTVAEIAPEAALQAARGRLDQVTGWLARHRIAAESVAVASTGDDAAHLGLLSVDRDATFIVAGAYAHSRVREWVLGGVTRDLLLHTDLCSMLSH
jgi:nucleotide-binding universal stress UspA family protein